MSLEKAIDMMHDFFIKAKDDKVKARNRPRPIFDSKHSSVTDNKDHFPIDTIGRARNALARAKQYGGEGKPDWYSGSASSFQNAIERAVHGAYPSIGKDKKAEEKVDMYKKAIESLKKK